MKQEQQQAAHTLFIRTVKKQAVRFNNSELNRRRRHINSYIADKSRQLYTEVSSSGFLLINVCKTIKL